MSDIGTAYVRIAPNMTGIQGKIAAGFKGSAGPATAALGDEVNSNSGPFQKAISGLGGVAKAGGIAIASGIAAGAAGLAVLTGKMLTSGAELEQQLGGSEAVFESYAGNIQKIAQDSYKNMGLSQNEFLQGANKMGSLYQGAGFDVQKSMEMSAGSIQRATDVASIMGIDTTMALESVTAMAKGNFTMMDNLGVAMNDTALQNYALEKGIGKSVSAMSTQEKVGLATQLFMEKTGKYAGNYAKENETLAGSINTTKKAFDDFLSGGGDIQNFIDSIINTINIAVPKIIEILPKIVTGLSSILTQLAPVISQALPTLLPALIQGVVGLINSLVAQLPTILQVIVGALPMFISAFVQVFIGIVQALPQIISSLVAALPDIIDAIVEGLTSPESLTAILLGAVQLFLAIVEAIPKIITSLVDALPQILDNIITTVTSPEFIQAMIDASITLFMAIIQAVPQILGSLGTAMWSILTKIGEVLSWENISEIGGNLVKGLWQGISDLGSWIIEQIKGFGQGILDGIKSFFGIHSPSTVFAGVGENLGLGLANGLDDSAGIVSKAATRMADDALSAINTPLVSPELAFGGVTNAAMAKNAANNTTQTVTIGTVALGDSSAVKEFFKQLNQDNINVGMGLTPIQGAQ